MVADEDDDRSDIGGVFPVMSLGAVLVPPSDEVVVNVVRVVLVAVFGVTVGTPGVSAGVVAGWGAGIECSLWGRSTFQLAYLDYSPMLMLMMQGR